MPKRNAPSAPVRFSGGLVTGLHLARLQQQNQQLLAEKRAHLVEIASLKQRVTALQAGEQQLSKERDELRQQQNLSYSEKNNLHTQLAIHQQQLTALRELLTQVEQEKLSLSTTLQHKLEEAASLESSSHQEVLAISLQHEAHIMYFENQIEDLKQQINTITHSYQQLQTTHQQLLSDYDELLSERYASDIEAGYVTVGPATTIQADQAGQSDMDLDTSPAFNTRSQAKRQGGP